MTGHDGQPLSETLGRLRFLLAQPIDFTRTDTDTTLVKVRLLVAAATYFNTLVITDIGGRIGPVREAGLVEQVVAAAFQTYEDEDPHPHPFDKAAMLLRGITQGHPFTDGNKRTGFLLASYYLELSGISLPSRMPVDIVVEFCLRVSAGATRDIGAISDELKSIWLGSAPNER
jgi:death-on-curing protein